MSDVRVHPVPNEDAHARVVSEYRRDGYEIVDLTSDGAGVTTLEYQHSGSLLAHLALFFTVGWLLLGVPNLVYALHVRRRSRDRVRVEVQE